MGWILLSLCAGTLLAPAHPAGPVWGLFAFLLVAGGRSLAGPRPTWSPGPPGHAVLLFVLSGLAFLTSGAREAGRLEDLRRARARLLLALPEGAPVVARGRVLEGASPGGGYGRFEMEGSLTAAGQGRRVTGKVRLLCGGRGGWRARRGARVEVVGSMRHPPGRRNPHGFDYRSFLGKRSVAAVVDVEESGVRTLAEPAGTSSALSATETVAFRLRDRLERRLPERSAGMMRAFLWGDRSRLPVDVRESLARAGLAHLLALSGLHLALLLGAAHVILRLAVRSDARRNVSLLGLAVIYALATGLRPSLVRATSMLGHHVLSRRLGRPTSLLQSLWAAGVLALATRPHTIYDLGFQFSMTATLGILVFTGPLRGALLRFLPRSAPVRAAATTLAVSVSSQVFLLPLQIVHFSQWCPLSPLVNLVFVPLFTLPLLLAFLGNLVEPLAPPLGIPLLTVAGSLLSLWARLLARCLEVLPLVWGGGRNPALALGPALAAAVVLGLRPHSRPSARARRLTLGLSLVTYLALVLPPAVSGSRPKPPGPRVVLFDVGQGDAAQVTWPDGRQTLIDGGPSFGDAGAGWRVLLPYYKGEGTRSLGQVLLTHAHRDHYGGLARLPSLLGVERLVLGAAARGKWLRRYETYAVGHGVDVRRAARGDTLVDGPGWGMRVLWPRRDDPLEGSGANDRSLVTLVWWNGGTFLLMGDLEAEGEAELLASGDLPRGGLLKVGHHGSRTSTSSDFLDRVEPEAAVISCGSGNRFGHPHPEALERLASRGVRLFRTDRHGAVIVQAREWGAEVRLLVPGRTVRLSLEPPRGLARVRAVPLTAGGSRDRLAPPDSVHASTR
jgi:competence protein ComEC